MNEFMKIAIEEAEIGIKNGDGGSFGCVIVKDGHCRARSQSGRKTKRSDLAR